jgi:hypothetical protein
MVKMTFADRFVIPCSSNDKPSTVNAGPRVHQNNTIARSIPIAAMENAEMTR